jgi:hypothetical protein
LYNYGGNLRTIFLSDIYFGYKKQDVVEYGHWKNEFGSYTGEYGLFKNG